MQLVGHPLGRVARWRYVIIAIVAIASGVVSGGRGDWNEFVDAGRAMFGSAGLHVYELHHDVQTGPFSLAIAWLFSHTPRDGFVLATAVSASLGVLVVRLLELTFRSKRGHTRFELLVLIGGVLIAITWAKLGGYGHLDDAITLTAAVVSLYELRAGLTLLAAVAIGIGIATKPWGVMFLPLALASRRGRRLPDWRPPVIASGVAALAWLPFIVGAPHSLEALRPTVNIAPDSVLDLFGVTNESLPEWIRIAQLLAGITVGVVLVLRHRPESVIAAAVAVRLATDPATWSYYTPGLAAGVLAWDLIDGRRLPWATLIVVGALAPTWLVPSDNGRAVLRGAVSVAVVVWALLRPQCTSEMVPEAG